MPLDFAKERAFRIGAQTLSKNIRNLPGLSNLLNGNTFYGYDSKADNLPSASC